jgi:glycerol kinase
MAKYVLAMDQGTTSSRSIIFDKNGTPVESLNQEFEQIYPKAGWVEHRPLDIWNTQLGTTKAILKAANVLPSDIVAVGVTNQRETTTNTRANRFTIPSFGNAVEQPAFATT